MMCCFENQLHVTNIRSRKSVKCDAVLFDQRLGEGFRAEEVLERDKEQRQEVQVCGDVHRMQANMSNKTWCHYEKSKSRTLVVLIQQLLNDELGRSGFDQCRATLDDIYAIT